MSGYVASARIVHAAARLATGGRASDEAVWVPVPEPPELLIVDADTDTGDRPDRGPTLVERHEAFRERWAQLTFFLFDTNSWRS